MTQIQLSLLGGSPQIDRNKRYRTARYDFGAGPTEPTELFAMALLRHIRPNWLIILGTSGSMWDVLLESLGLSDAHEDEFLALLESAGENRTSQAQLDELAPVLAERLEIEVRLRLIPYGRTSDEQIAILKHMAEDIPHGSTVSLDLTHGLRHLPMLAQMSALYLRKAKEVNIQGLYYGALDMSSDGVTPVMDLKGLLHLADWIAALHTFDKDGDYSVFQPLLSEPLEEDATQLLGEAAFFERTNRPDEARGKLRRFRAALNQNPPSGVAGMFSDTLRNRIAWIDAQSHYGRQRELALQYLGNGDYLRAAIMGYEAFLTRQVKLQNLDQNKGFDVRQQAKSNYKNQAQHTPEYESYRLLDALRNSLAHGYRNTQGTAQRALSSPYQLAATLERLFTTLLPDD